MPETSSNPIANLQYFIEWGNPKWGELIEHGLRHWLGTDLSGKHVLEIGTRYGKMAAFFGLLGARVTGIDVVAGCQPIAENEARKWGTADRFQFLHYDGDLDVLPDSAFDVVFTKSVLVCVKDLPGFLAKLDRKLRPGAKVLFVENSQGGLLNRLLRFLGGILPRRHYGTIYYFDRTSLAQIAERFDVDEIKEFSWPPVYGIYGHKKS